MTTIILLLITTLTITTTATSSLHHHLTTDPSLTTTTTQLTTYFQVTKPILLPNTSPIITTILHHDFSYTYCSPPVSAPYNPPSQNTHFKKIILEWSATCQGLQFDRIFGVWLDGVELLRSCTAEPRATGIQWTVTKDVTRYYSLLMQKNLTLDVYLGNIVDSTYTGVYHVNVSFHYYPFEKNDQGANFNGLRGGSGENWADLVIPISRNKPLNDGLWFEVVNETDVQRKEVVVPRNVYKAVLEVYVSFHENDEFWPTNVVNEYISDNNLTGLPGNGPFREVVVSLDGGVVGAIWPFTVVYTGGVNPLLWRPITGIGSFDLPSYDIEITPFLGSILDGKSHEIGFSVTNALNVWYIDANLHLWLDEKSETTSGELLTQKISPLHVSLVSNYTGLNGTFDTKVTRSIKSTGWVQSSLGKIVTESSQDFDYSNFMVMTKDGDAQLVNQRIEFNDTVSVKKLASISVTKSLKAFAFFIDSDTIDQGNGCYVSVANITLGFNEKKSKTSGSKTLSSVLENVQNGQGSMLVKGNLVVSGLGSTQETYKYADDKYCYFRDVSSSNYTIIYDKEGDTLQTVFLLKDS
ncbi:peptide-N(4)-(N-acetyl-beta-glucosaminyl) asparagine amidase A [Tanacetum coccineum]